VAEDGWVEDPVRVSPVQESVSRLGVVEGVLSNSSARTPRRPASSVQTTSTRFQRPLPSFGGFVSPTWSTASAGAQPWARCAELPAVSGIAVTISSGFWTLGTRPRRVGLTEWCRPRRAAADWRSSVGGPRPTRRPRSQSCGPGSGRVGEGGFDVVMCVTSFQNHSTDAALSRASKAAGVPYVRVHKGRPLACLRALGRHRTSVSTRSWSGRLGQRRGVTLDVPRRLGRAFHRSIFSGSAQGRLAKAILHSQATSRPHQIPVFLSDSTGRVHQCSHARSRRRRRPRLHP